MGPGTLDHLLFLAFAVLMPVYTARVAHPRFWRAVRAGDTDVRERAYRTTTRLQWAFCLVLLAGWLAAGRDWSALGLGLPGWGAAGWGPWRGWGLAVGGLLCVAGAVLLERQLGRVRREPEARAEVRAAVRAFADFLPRTAPELAAFRRLSFTAGVCEELVARGFLLWYLGHWMALPLALAASSAVFGLGHLYQGWSGVLRTAALGLALALLYVATGSLWLAMLMHAYLDVNQGTTVYLALGEVEPGGVAGAGPLADQRQP